MANLDKDVRMRWINLDEAFDVHMRWSRAIFHQNNRYLPHNKICVNCNIKLLPITHNGSVSMCTKCMKRYDFQAPQNKQ